MNMKKNAKRKRVEGERKNLQGIREAKKRKRRTP